MYNFILLPCVNFKLFCFTRFNVFFAIHVTFVVFEEISRGNKEGNHWYSLSLNIQAGRFEVLDSMRGESSESLMNHASNLVSRIKSIWKVHYSTSKIQIENWEIKVIDVPMQETKYVTHVPFFFLFVMFLFLIYNCSIMTFSSSSL
jgi:hypothetical protein